MITRPLSVFLVEETDVDVSGYHPYERPEVFFGVHQFFLRYACCAKPLECFRRLAVDVDPASML